MDFNIARRCFAPRCGVEVEKTTWFCDDHAKFRQIERDLFVSRVGHVPTDDRSLTAVYVIGSDRIEAVKIGIAVDIQKRMATLQTGFPFPLQLYSALYSGRLRAQRLEAAVHAKLKECDVHLNGEWFDVSPVDAARAVRKVAESEGITVLSPWDYVEMIGWSGEQINHETFSLHETCRQLMRDNVVHPFGMVDKEHKRA